MPQAASSVPARSTRFGRLWLGAALLPSLLAPIGASAQALERRIAAAIDRSRLAQAHIGVSVLDCQTGAELAGIRANDPRGFTPASNLKLLTSGAALLTLGPEFEFTTRFILDGDRLVVRGDGDPALADPDLLIKMHMSVDEFVDRLVDAVGKANPPGIREVIVDDRVFDREYVHPDWPTDQLNRSYCAQVSGLNFHANILNVFVSPGARPGAEVVARSEPSGSWLAIRSVARTVREGSTEVWLERDKEPFVFRLHGAVRTAPDAPIQVTVHEPGLLFARLLADRLARAGLGAPLPANDGGGARPGPVARLVGLDEPTPEVRADGAIAAPSGPRPGAPQPRIVSIVRTPIGVVLERCNVDSENLYAESLLKAAGHRVTGQPGSWSNGTAVVRMQLREQTGGDTASQLVMADGSGLSRHNRVTPEMLTKWMRAIAAKPAVADAYVRSMALAGEEGTLKKRFKGARLKNEVRAKSGFINKVRTLSGFVTNPATGRRVAFSVLVDELGGGGSAGGSPDQRAKELHEAVVEIVDEWLDQDCRSGGVAPAAPGTSAGKSDE